MKARGKVREVKVKPQAGPFVLSSAPQVLDEWSEETKLPRRVLDSDILTKVALLAGKFREKGELPNHFLQRALNDQLGHATLPDRPYVMEDLPNNLPEVTQYELFEYESARYTHLVTLADFDMKRAAILRKLLLYCNVEDGDFKASIENDELVVRKECTSCGSITLPH